MRTLYLPPVVGIEVLSVITAASPGEFFVKPGAEIDELVMNATRFVLNPILSCGMVNLGLLDPTFLSRSRGRRTRSCRRLWDPAAQRPVSRRAK